MFISKLVPCGLHILARPEKWLIVFVAICHAQDLLLTSSYYAKANGGSDEKAEKAKWGMTFPCVNLTPN